MEFNSKNKFLVRFIIFLSIYVAATPSNPFTCFAPLAYDANWESKGTSPCALPCPYDEVWDDTSTVDSAKSMYVALSWIGTKKIFAIEKIIKRNFSEFVFNFNMDNFS